MVIGCYFINDHWWLFYKWLLVVIVLMAISGFLLLIAIGGYFINGYWWLFY